MAIALCKGSCSQELSHAFTLSLSELLVQACIFQAANLMVCHLEQLKNFLITLVTLCVCVCVFCLHYKGSMWIELALPAMEHRVLTIGQLGKSLCFLLLETKTILTYSY